MGGGGGCPDHSPACCPHVDHSPACCPHVDHSHVLHAIISFIMFVNSVVRVCACAVVVAVTPTIHMKLINMLFREQSKSSVCAIMSRLVQLDTDPTISPIHPHFCPVILLVCVCVCVCNCPYLLCGGCVHRFGCSYYIGDVW